MKAQFRLTLLISNSQFLIKSCMDEFEIARLEREIRQYLGMELAQLQFEFWKQEGQTRLDLITVNSRHQRRFLFRYETGRDKIECLGKILTSVRSYRDTESSYTLQWSTRGERKLQTSYFRTHNVYETLDKFYFGRDLNTITVFSVV